MKTLCECHLFIIVNGVLITLSAIIYSTADKYVNKM